MSYRPRNNPYSAPSRPSDPSRQSPINGVHLQTLHVQRPPCYICGQPFRSTPVQKYCPTCSKAVKAIPGTDPIKRRLQIEALRDQAEAARAQKTTEGETK